MPSPVISKPQSPKTLSFPQAIKEVINDRKITRVEWNDTEEYGMLKNERLIIHTHGSDHTWMISSGDLMAEDWLVITEAN